MDLRAVHDCTASVELVGGGEHVAWGLVRVTGPYVPPTEEEHRQGRRHEIGHRSDANRRVRSGFYTQGYLRMIEPAPAEAWSGEHVFGVMQDFFHFSSGSMAYTPAPTPIHMVHSVFEQPNLVLCPMQADGWPVLHVVEENNFLVPEALREDAVELVRWLNFDEEAEGRERPALPADNFYAVVGSVSAEDAEVWERAWEGEGLLNACLTLRVAVLGQEHEALGFTGVDLIRARLDGVQTYEEMYWVMVAYRALRYAVPGLRLEIATEVNPVRALAAERFSWLQEEFPEPEGVLPGGGEDGEAGVVEGSEADYRARLEWMSDAGQFEAVQTPEEQLEAARERAAEE